MDRKGRRRRAGVPGWLKSLAYARSIVRAKLGERGRVRHQPVECGDDLRPRPAGAREWPRVGTALSRISTADRWPSRAHTCSMKSIGQFLAHRAPPASPRRQLPAELARGARAGQIAHVN